MEFVSLFETEFGTGAVVASEQGIRRVYLPHGSAEDIIVNEGLEGLSSSELTERASRMLTLYFKGERLQFELVPVDINISGRFRRHVLELIRSIPFGEVRSYGEVASSAGSPKASRAVGGAMASNPVPIIIPCHRVIAGNGRLTGFTAPGGLVMKKFLLEMEGVEFKGELICQGK